jgi:hypothetical protein
LINALIVEVESREKAARGLVRFGDYSGVCRPRTSRTPVEELLKSIIERIDRRVEHENRPADGANVGGLHE